MNYKAFILKYFPSLVSFRNQLVNSVAHAKYKNKNIQDVFTDIYVRNHWQGEKSRSGTGSDSIQTAEVKQILKRVIQEYDVAAILDIPCGDFNWLKEIDLSRVTYYGADIVEKIIHDNNAVHKKENIRFVHADITSSKLPEVDLIFCRDCLVHFSYQDIERAKKNLKKSKSKYLLTTTFPAHTNANIVTGNWRPLNLQSSPFNFPTPLKIFNEKCTEDPRYNDKSLALWWIEDLI